MLQLAGLVRTLGTSGADRGLLRPATLAPGAHLATYRNCLLDWFRRRGQRGKQRLH